MGFRIINLFGRSQNVRKWLSDIPYIIENTYNMKYYKVSNTCITNENVNNFIKNEYEFHKKSNVILNPVTFLDLNHLNYVNYFLKNSHLVYHQPINVLVHDEKIDPFIFNLFCRSHNFSYGLYNTDYYNEKQVKISKLIVEKHI